MGIKATLQEDHIPVNKYILLLSGVPGITVTSVSGLETEIDTVDLPDRTRASGGNTKATEMTIKTPMHHTVERIAMELWMGECVDPITSTAKKPGTLIMLSGTGKRVATYVLTGMWISKRKLPDLAFEDEGAMAQIEWTLQVDDVTVLS